ncbi:MAG: TetR/AcrR family transcriptional regulator [Acidimicrobiales bacterium]
MGRTSQVENGHEPRVVRQRLVRTAFELLRDEGFSHASASAIAVRCGLDPDLITVHFDSVNDLLVEALAHSSRTQLVRYQKSLAEVGTVAELVQAADGQLREDFDSGHVKVLAEMVAASAADKELRAAVLAQVQPWMAFTEETLERVLVPSGLINVVSPEQGAFTIVALFVGMELLAGIGNQGDEDFIADLFDSVHHLTGLLGALSDGFGSRPEPETGPSAVL